MFVETMKARFTTHPETLMTTAALATELAPVAVPRGVLELMETVLRRAQDKLATPLPSDADLSRCIEMMDTVRDELARLTA
ncbi:MAG: hypothetical protein ACXWP0_12080 [Ktedonobacterales bacterium]